MDAKNKYMDNIHSLNLFGEQLLYTLNLIKRKTPSTESFWNNLNFSTNSGLIQKL